MVKVWWDGMIDFGCLGVLVTDGRTDRQTDICDSRVAFATEKSPEEVGLTLKGQCTVYLMGFRLKCKWHSFKNNIVSMYFRYCRLQDWHFLDDWPDPVREGAQGSSWQWWQQINIWRIQMITFGTLWMVKLKINIRSATTSLWLAGLSPTKCLLSKFFKADIKPMT